MPRIMLQSLLTLKIGDYINWIETEKQWLPDDRPLFIGILLNWPSVFSSLISLVTDLILPCPQPKINSLSFINTHLCNRDICTIFLKIYSLIVCWKFTEFSYKSSHTFSALFSLPFLSMTEIKLGSMSENEWEGMIGVQNKAIYLDPFKYSRGHRPNWDLRHPVMEPPEVQPGFSKLKEWVERHHKTIFEYSVDCNDPRGHLEGSTLTPC